MNSDNKHHFDFEVLLGFLMIAVPFLLFLSPVNTRQLVSQDYKDLALLYFFVASFVSFLAYLSTFILRALNTYVPLKVILLAFSLCFYELFFYQEIKDLLFEILSLERHRYALLFLIFINMLTVFFVIKNFRFSKVFSGIYGIAIFAIFITSQVLGWGGVNSGSKNLKTSKVNILNGFEGSSVRNNVYYVILDGMASLDMASHKLGIKTEKFYDFMKANDLIYIENSRSSNDETPLTLASAVNFFPSVVKGDKIYSDGLRFFPHMMFRDDIPLLATLDSLGYEFKWIGNTIFPCNKYMNFDRGKTTCPDTTGGGGDFLNSYLFSNFLRDTPISHVQEKFSIATGHYYFQMNDSIGRYLREYQTQGKPSLPTFTLIHHMAPHWPYNFNEDCTERYKDQRDNKYREPPKEGWDGSGGGYKAGYECALKKTQTFIKAISANDPNAVIFIQGDHGWRVEGNLSAAEERQQRFQIFSLAKVPPFCEKYLSPQIDNINAVRLALACATETSPKLLKQRSYFRVKENNESFYRVYEFVGNS